MSAKIIPSVSAVLFCKDHLYLIRRQPEVPVFPGYHAYPGGKVDSHDSPDSEIHPKFSALVREIREELDYDLAAGENHDNIMRIEILGDAVTPDFSPYRFSNTFIYVEFKDRPEFRIDGREIAEERWITPSELWSEYERGEILMVPPLLEVVAHLKEGTPLDQFVFRSLDFDQNKIPMIESLYGIRQLMPRSRTLPPAERTNCFLIGREEGDAFVLVDPSPYNQQEYQRLVNTLSDLPVNSIMITHHHVDHYQYSVDLAKLREVPILISFDSWERIRTREGEDYFEDVTIHYLEDGQVVGGHLGRDILVYHIPGHDEGQMGLGPNDDSWFLAGDLIQEMGTVVVGGEEGDMEKYLHSLEYILDLEPKRVLPSHGNILGGTALVRRTYEHRLMREEQVRQLMERGYKEGEILDEIYPDLEESLKRYALKNIHSHIKLIRKRG